MSTPRKKPAKRRCKGTNKAGGPCKAPPLADTDTCISHSPREVQESAGFGGSQPGAGHPRRPRPSEIAQQRVEAAIDQVLDPYFRALGIVGWEDNGTPILDTSAGAMEVGRSNTGSVFLTSIADLGARIAAAEKLQDRVYGKPKQATELTGRDGGAIAHTVAPDYADPKVREAADVLLGRPADSEE